MKCPVCNHKHKEYNNDTFEMEYVDTAPFKQIEGHFTMKSEYSYDHKEVYLYACPECNNVVLED